MQIKFTNPWYHDTVLELVQGDITQQDVDAIVNAANPGLAGGGGVDGAIHRAGGPDVMQECRIIGRCDPGKAVITGGGNLTARNVIHAVGPVYKDGRSGEPELLASAYNSCLRIALRNELHSIAFPSLATGAYRYPVRQAAHVALKTVIRFLKEERHPFDVVRFVLFDPKTYEAFETALTAITTK